MHGIRRMILVSLAFLPVVYAGSVLALQEELSSADMQALLQERDTAIIQLQHTVRDLMTRLEAVENTVGLVQGKSSISDTPPASLASQPIAEITVGEEVQGGFTRLEVDEQLAERALERTLVQGGALLLPAWSVEFAPAFGYSLNQFDFPATVVEDDLLFVGSHEVERNVLAANLNVRIGLPFDSQFELGLPYSWVDQEIKTRIQGSPVGETVSLNGNGFGSLRVGIAKTFVRERGWRPDVVGRLTWNTGSGDRTDNGVFFSGYESVGGSLVIIKRSDPMVFLGSVSYQTFFEEDGVEPGDQFAFTIGTALAVSPTSSLSALISNQFLGETELNSQRIDGSSITSATLNLGASTIVARGWLLNLTTGIGISENAPDYSIGISGSVRTNSLRNFIYKQ